MSNVRLTSFIGSLLRKFWLNPRFLICSSSYLTLSGIGSELTVQLA
jgi:hypothetical protein